jgi:hypothetical protein
MASKIRSAQIGLIDAAMSIAGLACLAFGIYFLAIREVTLAVASLGAALVVLFAATIDRFESLKGLGMEANIRRLDNSIDKAELAMERLKELAGLTGASLISLSSMAGRHGGAPSVSEAYDLSRRVASILERLNAPEADIRVALTPWAKAAAVDLFQKLVQRAHELLLAWVSESNTRMQNLSSPEQVEFAKKCQEALGHPGRLSSRISTWQLGDFERKALELIDTMPLLDEPARQEHRQVFERAAAELKFLAVNLDTQDKALWVTVRQESQ